MSGERRPPGELDHSSFANAAWSIPSYLLGGMLVYGGLGWLLGRWLHVPALFPVGVVLGMAFAVYLVYLRYGR